MDLNLPFNQGAVAVPGFSEALANIRSLVDAGGPVVVILLVLSVIALAVILLKIWQFAASGMRKQRAVDEALEHWQQGRPRRALDRLRGARNPVSRVVEIAMRGRNQRRADTETVREEAQRVAGLELENLRSYLRVLEVIGALSPLLGLLGTVLGMIEAFRQLEQAGARIDPALLSGGIWQALLTTAVGLSVAIPAVVALNWFERRVERVRLRMEDALTQVFTVQLLERAAPAHEDSHAGAAQAAGA